MQTVRDGTRWMLRLEEGDDLHGRLSELAQAHSLRAGAVLMGIGQLKTATIGFWNGREYLPKDLGVPHELISLGGSIAVADGRPSVHLHAALGGSEGAVTGGHLVRGVVGLLAEMYVEEFPERTFGRPMRETMGLRMLDLEPPPNP